MKPATNGIGWCVETYLPAEGWVQASRTYGTEEEAQAVFACLPKSDKPVYRVYEVLT